MSDNKTIEGKGNFERVLHSAMLLPGIKINRTTFLRKELSKYFDEDVITRAIDTNPAQAGLSLKNLERIAKSCITNETVKVTTLSAAAGIPGGFAMAATVPADVVQFFGHIIRILQKLVYLYGWQELFSDDEEELDDATVNQLTLFIGVMFGVSGANAAITKIAASAAVRAEKTLVTKALTKGTIYPIVKKVAQSLSIRMTKSIFASGVGKAIPVLGALVSGSITFIGFRPMAKQLQKYLISLPTADVDFYKQENNIANVEIIDVDFSDIVIDEEDENIDVVSDT